MLVAKSGFCQTHAETFPKRSRSGGGSPEIGSASPVKPDTLPLPKQHYRASRSGSRNPIYSSMRWRRLSALTLKRDPLCGMCREAGAVVPATLVDHIIEIIDDPSLAYDSGNLQPLCHACHAVKTAKVALGRRKRLSDFD